MAWVQGELPQVAARVLAVVVAAAQLPELVPVVPQVVVAAVRTHVDRHEEWLVLLLGPAVAALLVPAPLVEVDPRGIG